MATIDVHDHIVNVILDIIGDGLLFALSVRFWTKVNFAAAFDYQFGALDNKQDELREIIHKSR